MLSHLRAYRKDLERAQKQRDERAATKRRDHSLIADLEGRLEFVRAEERKLKEELERAYRAEPGTIYDTTTWFRITWRGFSGRNHEYPKPVRRVDGWWTTGKGHGLCPAINGSVVKAVPIKKKARK